MGVILWLCTAGRESEVVETAGVSVAVMSMVRFRGRWQRRQT